MIDFHTDTIYRLVMSQSDETLLKNSFSVDIERMLSAGVRAVCLALFTPNENDLGFSRWSLFEKLHERFVFELANASAYITQATKAGDIEKNRLSAVLTVEDIGPLDGDVGKLSLLKSWGVRIASLIWNNENAYAYPNSRDGSVMSRGLKKKGLEAVEALSSMDIIIDVSHLNDGGFYDVFSSGVKMVATHSNSRALCNHPRNITDDMARKIADRGGIIGLNVCPLFLRDYPWRSTEESLLSSVSDMVRHVMYFYKIAGEDVLAIGSDLDGTGGVLEIASPLDYEKLREPLKKAGLTDRQLDKFYFLNGLRVLG